MLATYKAEIKMGDSWGTTQEFKRGDDDDAIDEAEMIVEDMRLKEQKTPDDYYPILGSVFKKKMPGKGRRNKRRGPKWISIYDEAVGRMRCM